jgi:transposase InsO family protein
VVVKHVRGQQLSEQGVPLLISQLSGSFCSLDFSSALMFLLLPSAKRLLLDLSNPVHDAAELAAYLASTRCKRLPHLAVPVDKDPIIVRWSEDVVPLTREALAIEVDRGIDADGVVDVLDRLVLQHGAPHYVRFDNGPEFVAHAVSDWCRFNGAGSLFIDPGAPWQNAWIESFNGRLRDELLNSWRLDSLREARVIIEDWRCDYNANRPHSAHGELTPTEFALQWTRTHQPQAA